MLIKSALQIASPSGTAGKLSILIFHRVLPAPDPLFPGEIDCAMFDRLIGWVSQWFNILPLDEAITRLRSGKIPARSISLTFDDGYADNLLFAAPILEKYQATATFFIATAYLDGGRMWNDTVIESVREAHSDTIDARFLGLDILDVSGGDSKRDALSRLIPAIKHLPGSERAEAVARIEAECATSLPAELMLSSQQVILLRKMGMGIGAHTVSHPILAKLDLAAARQEIADSRDFLQNLLGERISLFAYPNGRHESDYTDDHAKLTRELGFDAAVTTNPGVSKASTDPYQLPRFTPWDRTRTRFGMRLLLNLIQPK